MRAILVDWLVEVAVERWSLVQVLLSSSYSEYGLSSLKEYVYAHGLSRLGIEGPALLWEFRGLLVSTGAKLK
ncbi:hypothetical protein AgCh_005670 [Apium graveolens]